MYTLEKPVFAVSDVLAICTGAVEDAELKARLMAIEGNISAVEPNYDLMAKNHELHLLPRVESVGSVSKDELVSLYSDHLSATKGAARAIYDAIKNAAPGKLCPLCSIGAVAHLDHHLPKRKYPDLSVLPINLVPSCHFCNDTKKARFPKKVSEQTFHPYYDAHLLVDQWVTATLDQGPPPVLVFVANAPTTWLESDRKRVARHFTVCGLATTFTVNANNRLSSLKERLISLENIGGSEQVRKYLAEERDAYAKKRNSWEHVLYQTLESDNWFVNGGFHDIP
ncbi:hypothetical protein HUE56_26740 (plasmid) [Azospirillum oryzae]|uniref:HNH endonuclease n=1 Tax=Azospirillum oryzae TaxID=286727 RepID=A0A6N1AR73_9PROT|nr:hypothetical protein [Azospirillum oryzae]KAA0587057.1 hypothetical protein FZ938_20100 [Azospirillum oryzae]QKS54080.1 hypothetical protein HUE56_26740 [Azospirillum oryzae]GLR82263.1 HNH endonuclease [Azospirillum oryzae]